MQMKPQQERPSMGRWYILVLISLMYLITYLDRVNISTAAPVISKEFGFDKITMGVIFSAFVWAYAMFQVPGGWLGDRFGPRNVLTIIVGYWSIMTAATAAATGATSFVVLRFLFGVGEAGAFPGATRAMQLWYPRQARLRPRDHAQREPRRSSHCAADCGVDHDDARLAIGILYLRRGRHFLVHMVVPGLSQSSGRTRVGEPSRTRTYPGDRRKGQRQSGSNREEGQRALGDAAPISQYVGDHVRLFYLRLLPLDLPELAAVLSGGIQAFHAAQGRPLSFTAALGRCRRRYGWWLSD